MLLFFWGFKHSFFIEIQKKVTLPALSVSSEDDCNKRCSLSSAELRCYIKQNNRDAAAAAAVIDLLIQSK